MIVCVITIISSSCCSIERKKKMFHRMFKLLFFSAVKVNVDSLNILPNVSFCVQMGLEQHEGY